LTFHGPYNPVVVVGMLTTMITIGIGTMQFGYVHQMVRFLARKVVRFVHSTEIQFDREAGYMLGPRVSFVSHFLLHVFIHTTVQAGLLEINGFV
jgi:hypothetical protein